MKILFFRLLIYFFSAFLVLQASACTHASHKKPHGKLKKGKRIPCPLKDC